ncbi:MAG TPA: hypothetical protein VFK48_02405 [Usitatibacter sp.]|nr:hypothetical protein [Usitatibacter sp.]
MNRWYVIPSATALLVAGCSAKLDEKKLEERIRMAWRPCSVVVPDKFRYEKVDARTARVSYVLRMQDPRVVNVSCTQAKLLLLQALANSDNIAKHPPGTEFPVTEEFSLK